MVTALLISFPVIGLDQFLRTSPARLAAQPYTQAGHWVTDSLMMLPLFAAAIWAGDRIASRAGLGTARRTDVLKRALIIALLAALVQVPVLYEVNRSYNPVQAQPLVFPQAHDSGDVYWVAPWVVPALVCACLAPVAVWAACAISRRTWLPRGAAAVRRAAVLTALLAALPVLAWLLHQAAVRGYASQVLYTGAPPAITRHSYALAAAARGSRIPASPSLTAAPFAFAYQAAHALQDGLASQAAGLPVAVVALLWATRGLDGRNTHGQQESTPNGGVE